MSKRRRLVAVPEHIKSLDDVRIPDGATYIAQSRVHEKSATGKWYAFDQYRYAEYRALSKAIGFVFEGPVVNENWRKTYKVKNFIDAVQDEIIRRNGNTVKAHIPFPSSLYELWTIGEILRSQSKVLFVAQMKSGWWHGYQRISHAHYRTQPITPLFKSDVVDNNDKRAFSRAGFLRLIKEFAENLEVEIVGKHDYSTKHYISFPPTGECSIPAGTRALRQDDRGRWYCYTSIEDAVKEAPDRELAIETEVVASSYGKVYTLNAFLHAARKSGETKVIEEAVAADSTDDEIRALAHATLNNPPTKKPEEDFWDSMRYMKRNANSNAVQESDLAMIYKDPVERSDVIGKGLKVLRHFDDCVYDAQPDFVFGGDPCTIAFSTPSKPKPAAPVWPPDTVASTNGLVDVDLTLRLAAALQQD